MAMGFIILGLQFIIIAAVAAAATQSVQTISDSELNQHDTANFASDTVVHSDHAAHTVFTVEKYGAVGDGKHDSTQIDGMIAAVQIPESRKNSNKWLQFAKVESFTLVGRAITDGEGKNLWAGQWKRFNEQPFIQKSVAAVEKVFKGRKLLQPAKPKPNRGHGPQHN